MSALSPQQKLAAARLMAARRTPYFVQALMALVPRQSEAVPTMAVGENLVMLWNPKFVETITVQQCAAVLLHEVGHVIRDHARRGRAMGADPKKWNYAGDCEINDDLAAMKMDLPGDPWYPKHIGQKDGLTAEEYYRAMPPDPPSGTGSIGGGACGSVANGDGSEDPTKGDPQGRSQSDVTRIQKGVAADIQEHERQNGAGSVPGDLSRWADGMLKPPKVRWQDKLARSVRSAVAYRPGAVDWHYSQPAREQAAVGFGPGRPVLAGIVAPVPRITVAIDTSGSMSSGMLLTGVSETAGIFKAIGASVGFISCDAGVNAVVQARSWQDIARNLKGGGGTDFRPVFEAAEKMRPRPEILVFITDGDGPAPDHGPPGMRTIWLLVGRYRRMPATFGEAIMIDDDEDQD